MDRERIDDIICDIMVHDSPDRHVDGHDVITSFIIALLNDNGKVWTANYANVIADTTRM